MKNLDNIFAEFLEDFHTEEQKRKILTEEDLIIIEKKIQKLRLVEEFLTKFVMQGVVVKHKDSYNYSIVDRTGIVPQKFQIYQEESSDSYAPGQSIFFDHPAEVEIAVPNDPSKGIVVVSVASDNPHSYILNKKFTSYDDLCKNLAKFLLANTVSIEKKYYGLIDVKKEKNNNLIISEEKTDKQIKQNLSINRKNNKSNSVFTNTLTENVENTIIKSSKEEDLININKVKEIKQYVKNKKEELLEEIQEQEKIIENQLKNNEHSNNYEIEKDVDLILESMEIETKSGIEKFAQVKEIIMPNKLNNLKNNVDE